MGDANRVLFVGLVWPEPKSSAASQNVLSYITLFIEHGYTVTFACAADKTEQSENLSALGVDEKQILLNDSSFDNFVHQLQPNICIFDRFISEEQFAWRVTEAAPDCLKILDCEDLHFLRDARHKAHKQGLDSSLLSSILPYLYSDICKRELAAIIRCDASILLSEYEVAILSDIFGIKKDILHYCPFLISQKYQASTKAFDDRVDFVSIGSFRHAPNWDAVLTLKQSIWPALRKAIPKARCHIYGSYLSPKAKQLENKKEGFLVHGFVPDAFTAISSARLLLAPLNFGAGIKGKLVDAMQCGTPSITTPIGAEGLLSLEHHQQTPKVNGKELWANWPGAVQNINPSPDAFINSAIELYTNEISWTKAKQQCDIQFSQLFDYAKQSTALLQKVSDLQTNLLEHRRCNFLGQVLQHHTTNSTKYMSQWIEAKNRIPPG